MTRSFFKLCKVAVFLYQPAFNLFIFFFLAIGLTHPCRGQQTNIVTVDSTGWANNSVNTVIFRKNSLVTHKGYQYCAYYTIDQYMVLAKRKVGSSHWEIVKSQYKGDARDAHKSISIAVDGSGYVHVAWNQHGNPLNYTKGIKPGSIVLADKQKMTGQKEQKVSYPEFYCLKNGDLLFLYRDGSSGNGDLMINRYSVSSKSWGSVQDGLIDGEGKRNAYWQMAIDIQGTIHLSWVWRESADVASNHDLCYAKSIDGGKTWQKSTGERYELPMKAANAEYVCRIPQKSELINQTSMCADEKGRILIATYWRNPNEHVPQYHIIFNHTGKWETQQLDFRKTPFSLSGMGTKKIPISRPQVITWKKKGRHKRH
ncbi:BNR repeat-containing protein [Pedobacter sp. MW01-1-1]|uniref:BNR repeat-containing protein n=1 Tax=Pedobacter sp. MW01-1-1 TaxID=3383027 RepID=UPI003FF14813